MKYRPEIDGLRALAIIPVILFHAGFSLFGGGFVGVDVFFVISGFLITQILIEDIENKRFSIISFYERRARRILPALFVVMLACIPFAWILMLPSQMKDFAQSLVAVSLFASNILFWRESGYFDLAAEYKPLLHTWSLSVEEQYYVLFPVLLIFAWRYGKKRVFYSISIMAIVSLTLTEWGWRNQAIANFYLAPTRAWELLAGSMAALVISIYGVKKSNLLGLIGLAAICLSVFYYDSTTPFPSIYTLVPVIGAVLCVLYADRGTFVAKLLSSKGIVGIGLISYSTYLWHQPLFAFARIYLVSPSSYTMAILTILSFGLAYLSWKFIEAPFRNKKAVSRLAVLVFSMGGLVFYCTLGVYGHIKNGIYERYPETAAEILRSDMNMFENSVRFCWEALQVSTSIESACSLGSISEDKSFALIGDSHAGALQEALSNAALERGLGGIGLSYRSCPPLANAKDTVNDETCTNLRHAIFSEQGIKSLPHTVVVSARWALLIERERYLNDSDVRENGGEWIWSLNSDGVSDYSEDMKNEIIKSLNLIVSSGRNLIIVYPIPEMGWEIPTHLARSILERGSVAKFDASVGIDSFFQRNEAAFAALDMVGGEGFTGTVARVYPHEILCEQRCLAHFNGIPLYFDDDHLSKFGADLIVPEILDSFNYE